MKKKLNEFAYEIAKQKHERQFRNDGKTLN